MSQLKRIVLWLVLGIILIVYFSARLGVKKDEIKPIEQQISLLTVLVQPIHQEDFFTTKDFIGRVEAYQGQTIYPMINGFIQEILVDGGDAVTIGQPLFVLNQDIYRAKVVKAEADVLKAKSDMENAASYLKRVKHTASEALSENLVDNAENAYQSAQAAYFAAVATLEQAHIELGYTVLRSRLDGIVGNFSVAVGDYVSPQTDLGYVLQISPIKIAFSVPAKDYMNPKFFDDYEVQILLSDGSIYSGQAELVFMDNQFNQGTNSAIVYVLAENPQAILLPNSAVTVRLKKELKHEVLVPQTSVQMTGKGNRIYVLRDGIISEIPITIEGSIGDQYYIRGNINAHDLLIIQRLSAAQIGQKARGVLK